MWWGHDAPVLGVTAHPLRIGHLRLNPTHAIRELDVVLALLREVDALQRVGRHVHLDHVLAVVRNRKVEVREEEVTGRVGVINVRFAAARLQLANIAPHRQLIDHHLKVVVVDDRLAELFRLRQVQVTAA